MVPSVPYRLNMTTNLSGWFDSMIERNLATRTIDDYTANVIRFSKHIDVPLIEATTQDIRGWLNHQPLMPASRSQYRASLGSFFAWCVVAELIDVNPVTNVISPRVKKGLPRPLALPDIVRAINTAPQPLRVWIALGALGGLRRAEIAYLTAECITETQMRITGKGGHTRYVPIHKRVQWELDAWGVPEHGRLWDHDKEVVGQRVSRHLRSLGIDATCHQLRHSFATECYRACRDLLQVKQLLGHSSVATTEGYVSLVDDGASVVASIAA